MLTKRIIAAAIALLLTATGFARQSARSDEGAHVQALDNSWNRALETKDTAALNLLLADSFVSVDIDGMADASSYTGPQLVGVTASGGDADYLFGNAEVKLPHCTMIPAAPGPWGVKGARRDVCDIQIASAGDPVTGARVDVGNNEPDIIWH